VIAVRLSAGASADGYVLPMAIGTMLILAICAVTVVVLSSANQTATARANNDEKALTLAEDGVNNAMAVLAAADAPLDPSAVGSASSLRDGGTAAYTGSLAGSTWTLTGTGTVPSATAGAGDVTRTASVQVTVSTNGTAWQYLFSDDQSSCLVVADAATVAAPVYTRGDLCLGSGARVLGAPVQVEGTVTMAAGASIGAAGSPVSDAHLVGGCTGGAPDPHACTAADGVYATTLDQTAAGVTKPAIDLSGWYANARPGPSNPCTSGSVPGGFDNDPALNRSRGAFDPTSGGAYDCQYWAGGKLVGRLAWSPATSTLTALGTIFFDGPVTFGANVTYSGRATIYSSSTIAVGSGVHVCGVPACDATWSPNTNLLVLVAGDPAAADGADLGDDAVFQGAVYAVTDYRAGAHVQNWGPVVARQVSLTDDAGQTVPLGSLPPGAPGAALTIHTVSGTWRG
jgi:hypothetical protein